MLKTPPTISQDVPNEYQCSSWGNYIHNGVDHTSTSKSFLLFQSDAFAIVVLLCFFSINAFLLFFLRHSNQEVVEVTFCNSFRLCPQRGASNPCNRGNSRNFCRKQRRRSPQDNASSDCLLHIHLYTQIHKYKTHNTQILFRVKQIVAIIFVTVTVYNIRKNWSNVVSVKRLLRALRVYCKCGHKANNLGCLPLWAFDHLFPEMKVQMQFVVWQIQIQIQHNTNTNIIRGLIASTQSVHQLTYWALY